jgi:transposase
MGRKDDKKALTRRQRLAATLVAEGRSDAEVSAQVGASVSQVRGWRTRNASFKWRVAELQGEPGKPRLAALVQVEAEAITGHPEEAKPAPAKEPADPHDSLPGADETRSGLAHLTDQQLTAIELILAGRRQSDVAQQLGVTRQTLWRWRNDPAFIEELSRRQEERRASMTQRVTYLAGLAFDVMEDQLVEGNAQMAIDFVRILTHRSSSAADVVPPVNTPLSVERSSLELTPVDQAAAEAKPLEGQAKEAKTEGDGSRVPRDDD